MTFLTQEKANWKFIFILIIFATLIATELFTAFKNLESEIRFLYENSFQQIEKPLIEEKSISVSKQLTEEEEKPRLNQQQVQERLIQEASAILNHPLLQEQFSWLVYRNEEYGFEVEYPSFLSFEELKINDGCEPFPLKSFELNFIDIPADIVGGGVKIYNANHFAVHQYGEGYIIYDLKTKKWYTTNQQRPCEFNRENLQPIKEYSPRVLGFTKDKNPIYGGFWYADVGVSLHEFVVINEKKGIIISFLLSRDVNQLEYRLTQYPFFREQLLKNQNQLFLETCNKFWNIIYKSFQKMLSSFQFLE